MDNNLLQREKELFRLNEEINAKSKTLLDPANIDEILSENLKKRIKNSNQQNLQTVLIAEKDDENIEQCEKVVEKFEKVVEKRTLGNKSVSKNGASDMQNIIPKILEKKNVSSEGLIKFLKSKVAIIQMELDAALKQNEAHVKDLNVAIDKLKQFEQLKEQLLTKNTALEKTIKKNEDKMFELNKQLQDKESHATEINKELHSLKQEQKSLILANQNYEKRLMKASEDLENTKMKLTIAKDAEKEMRDLARKERQTFEQQMKELRKQRLDTMNDYKKLLIVVDDLKKKNFNYEQKKILDDFNEAFLNTFEN